MKLSQKELCYIAETAQIRIGKDTSFEAYNRKVTELQAHYHLFVECTTGSLMRMGLSYEEAFKTMIIVLKYGNAGTGINRQLPHLGDAGTGQYEQRVL